MSSAAAPQRSAQPRIEKEALSQRYSSAASHQSCVSSTLMFPKDVLLPLLPPLLPHCSFSATRGKFPPQNPARSAARGRRENVGRVGHATGISITISKLAKISKPLVCNMLLCIMLLRMMKKCT